MIEAGIEAGLHLIVEKPWQCSRAETDSLVKLAAAKRLLVAIHYQYCFLEAVKSWRHKLNNGVALRFGGRFAISRPNRLGISALENLGCHLLAIRAYAVPQSSISEINCAYNQRDERNVWVETEHGDVTSVDFFGNSEPVIQRFIARFDAALSGSEFPFSLDFAERVSNDVAGWARAQPSESGDRPV